MFYLWSAIVPSCFPPPVVPSFTSLGLLSGLVCFCKVVFSPLMFITLSCSRFCTGSPPFTAQHDGTFSCFRLDMVTTGSHVLLLHKEENLYCQVCQTFDMEFMHSLGKG